MSIYMYFYIFIFINSIIFFIFENYRLEKSLFILTLFGLFLFSGTRYFTGVDYESYLEVFRDVNSSLNLRGIEKLFLFISFCAKNYLKLELKEMFFLFEFINIFLLYKLVIKNLDRNLFIALYIWYSFYFLRLNMGQFRYCIAILICLNSLSYLYKKYYKRFSCSIILAFFIHRVSIIYLLLILVKSKIFSKKYLLFLPIITFIIGKTVINKKFLLLIAESTQSIKLKSMIYSRYIYEVNFSFYQLYLILILIILYFYKTKNLKIIILKRIFSLGVGIYFLFINLAIFSDRLSLIFVIVQVILFLMIINDCKNNIDKILIILFVTIICSYIFFSTIFNNLMYIPYQSWLFL